MIQIDMEMPGNCLVCPACNEYLMCAIPCNGKGFGENDVHDFTQGRPEWCPLSKPKSVTEKIKDAVATFCEDMGDMPSAVFISENTHKAIKKECEQLFLPNEALTYPTIYGTRIYSVHDDYIFLVGKSNLIRPGDMMLYSLEKGEPIV